MWKEVGIQSESFFLAFQANGDDNQAGHDYRARIQRLCQEEQDWLHAHDAATEAEFARRLQCLNEKHAKLKGEYEDAKRALKEATVRTRTILEEKIHSILNSEVCGLHGQVAEPQH